MEGALARCRFEVHTEIPFELEGGAEAWASSITYKTEAFCNDENKSTLQRAINHLLSLRAN